MKKYIVNFFKTLLLFWIINIIYLLIPIKIGVNPTDSLSCKVFTYQPVEKNEFYHKNEIIMFKPTLDFGVLGVKVAKMMFLKKIAAVGGDYLFCSQFGCTVNGKPVGKPLPIDKITTYCNFIGFIPYGYFAPIGESKRSYDVRFGGIQPIRNIKGKVTKCLLKMDLSKNKNS